MAEIKQLPRKHANKKMTTQQEIVVRNIMKRKNHKTWLEAKHEYFENKDKYDAAEEAEQVQEEPQKKRGTMTIEETKLGVTMVLSKEDCYDLGFLKGAHTKQVVKEIRKRLGLPDKKKKEVEQ